MRPAASRYCVTTFEPGARLDFTHGRRVRPRSTAFFASRPAATITCGFDVFVQLVMAAMTTAPWSRGKRSPSSSHQTACDRSPTSGNGHGGGRLRLLVAGRAGRDWVGRREALRGSLVRGVP